MDSDDGFTLVGSKEAEIELLEKSLEGKECGICFEKLPVDDLIATNCGHIFCRTCIKMWSDTKYNPKCPTCREKLIWKDRVGEREQQEREWEQEQEWKEELRRRAWNRISHDGLLHLPDWRLNMIVEIEVAEELQRASDSDSDSESSIFPPE